MPKPKLPKLRKNGILTDDEAALVKASLGNKMVGPAHNAMIINVGPRKEEKMYRENVGPPFFHIGRNRYTTVQLIEEWVEEMAQRAKQKTLANFGRRPKASSRHRHNSNRRRAA